MIIHFEAGDLVEIIAPSAFLHQIGKVVARSRISGCYLVQIDEMTESFAWYELKLVQKRLW